MKYIRHKSKGFFLFPANGDEHPWHKHMADFVGRDGIVSAGFVEFDKGIPSCCGRSESLRMSSQEEDTTILRKQMGLSV